MEALSELLLAIACFVLEVTIHSLVFVYLLFMAIFSSRYRQKLREEWGTSNWHRVTIVLGIGLYSAALAIALLVWIPTIREGDGQRANASKAGPAAIPIQFSPDEIEKMKDTKEFGELVDVAGALIKRKLEERKAEEQDRAERPATGSESK